MISDADVAGLCAAIYATPGRPSVTWDHLDPGDDPAHVCWGRKRIGDVDVVALRGSVTLLDWRRDLDAWADPLRHDVLGPIHPGFYEGMEATWAGMRPQLTARRTIVAGHSLGAGRACILTGMMLRDGFTPARRVCFGEPRPGFRQLADLIAKVPAASYRNGDGWHHDLVTDVPYLVPPLLYRHPAPLTAVNAPPSPGSVLGIFAYHHMDLYWQALRQRA
jgi:Lipase (class 3)